MFYVDTVEENQLPFDGCTVDENTSSKPPAPRFSQMPMKTEQNTKE